MKQSVSYKLLPLLPVLSGLTALILRLALYTMQNESGLLPRNHPLHLATVILAAVITAVVGFFVLRLEGSSEYSLNFPNPRSSGLGALLAGLWLIPAAFSIWENAVMRVELIWAALAFSAAACLFVSAFLLLKGKRPHFGVYFLICLYFTVHMVCRYRQWSGNPQVPDYIFSIFGCVSLSLFSYYRAAFALGHGRRRLLLFFGLMALFFCLPMIGTGDDREFFLSGFVWAATNLCIIDPPRKKSKEEPNASA